MKYIFIDNNRYIYTVERMAKCLQVSTRSYYDYRKGLYNNRTHKQEVLKQAIKASFEASESTYGSIRISSDLKESPTPASRPTVTKYMRQMGLRSKLTPKFTPRTTDSNHNNNCADNLLDRGFKVLEPNKIWVSDITYIKSAGDRFLYLTTIIDLFDRKVIGWSFSNDMLTANSVIPAFMMAIKHRGLSVSSAHGLMIHSDRGSQYTAKEFIKVLDKYGVIRSNSRKGNCWDNAVAESFFKSLKSEIYCEIKNKSFEFISSRVFRWIECWYNKNRRHSALGYLNIDEFWKKYLQMKKLLIAA